MAKITFTQSEKAQMNGILHELDPARHELLAHFQALLVDDDWRFVVSYARAEMRGALEIGLMGRAMAQTACTRGTAHEEGAQAFLESMTWMRNFGITDGADERFKRIADSDSPLFVAVDALLQLAQDRMFGTLDEEYVRLLDATS